MRIQYRIHVLGTEVITKYASDLDSANRVFNLCMKKYPHNIIQLFETKEELVRESIHIASQPKPHNHDGYVDVLPVFDVERDKWKCKICGEDIV